MNLLDLIPPTLASSGPVRYSESAARSRLLVRLPPRECAQTGRNVGETGQMAEVRVDNPNLLAMKDDTLYHFGLKRSSLDFPAEFGHVKVG